MTDWFEVLHFGMVDPTNMLSWGYLWFPSSILTNDSLHSALERLNGHIELLYAIFISYIHAKKTSGAIQSHRSKSLHALSSRTHNNFEYKLPLSHLTSLTSPVTLSIDLFFHSSTRRARPYTIHIQNAFIILAQASEILPTIRVLFLWIVLRPSLALIHTLCCVEPQHKMRSK